MARPAGLVRQVVRRLVRAPRFTIVAVLTLTLAVAANAAVFGLLYHVLLKPLAYPDSDRLVSIWHSAPGVNIQKLEMAPANYFTYREQSTTFQDVGMYRGDQSSIAGNGEPEQVAALIVTDGVLPILRVTPAAGRLFTRVDDAPNTPETVVLGYAFWLKRFGGSPSAIGQVLRIDGTSRQIIGVLPKDFRSLEIAEPAIVLPMRLDRGKTRLGNFSFRGVARLKPGVTLAQANADVGRMLPIMLRTFPAPEGFPVRLFEEARLGPNLRLLKDEVVGDIAGPLWILMGCIAIVLVIACANVANLWLVRLEGRRRELALRTALGAGRRRVAGELLLECVMIGAASGFLGVAIAALLTRALVALAPEGAPRLQEIQFDVMPALFTFGIAVLSSMLFGVLPILKYACAQPSSTLRDAGRSLSQSRQQHRMRSVLVVAQVALALVLLVGSGLMMRTFRALTHIDPGFVDPAHVQTFRIYIPSSAIADPDRVIRTHEMIRQRLQALPGVTAAAMASGVPMDGNYSADPVAAQDRTYREGELPKIRFFKFVMPGYFSTIGTPIIVGRDVTWSDIEQHAPVAIISRTFAVEYWQRPEWAVGKRIRVSPKDDWREIIGVAGDVYDDGLSRPATSLVYWPMIQDRFEGDAVAVRRSAAFVVRTERAGTEALLKDLQQAVWAIDANLPLFSVRTLDDLYRTSMERTSAMLVLLGVAGAMALLLGVMGLYGVIAYSVSQRTREIGIRIALGAQPSLVRGMFIRDGLRLALAGVVVGTIAAFAGVRLMSSLLFGVSSADPLTYVLVSVGLVSTAAVATYLPSRRATAVDPSIALRSE